MASHEITWFGPFIFDPATGTLTQGETDTRLSPRVATLLSLLIGRAGEVVSRDEMQTALGAEEDGELAVGLNACVQQLRMALGDVGDEPAYVANVAENGYRFIAPVSTGRQSVGDHTPRPAPAITPTETSSRALWFAILIIVLAAFAIMRAR